MQITGGVTPPNFPESSGAWSQNVQNVYDDWNNLDFALKNPSVIPPSMLLTEIEKLSTDMSTLQNSPMHNDQEAYKTLAPLAGFLAFQVPEGNQSFALGSATSLDQANAIEQYVQNNPNFLSSFEGPIQQAFNSLQS